MSAQFARLVKNSHFSFHNRVYAIVYYFFLSLWPTFSITNREVEHVTTLSISIGTISLSLSLSLSHVASISSPWQQPQYFFTCSLYQISNQLLIVRALRVSTMIFYHGWFLYMFGFISVKWREYHTHMD